MARSPQEEVAAHFMAYKGYPQIEPDVIEQLNGQYCWYFYYDLPEGRLELEIFWNGRDWESTVTAFLPHHDRTPEPVGR